MDDCWMENVEPLLEALERLGIDPVVWAADHDFAPFFTEGTREMVDQLTGIEPDLIFFACGYLQATGNLTGLSWEEQIRQQLEKEKMGKEMADHHPDSAKLTPKLQQALADGEVHTTNSLVDACYGDEAPPTALQDVTHVLHEMQAVGKVIYIAHARWKQA